MPILLVGSGHVFELQGPIQFLIRRERPDVVALELDADRFQGLLARRAGRQPSAEERRRAPRVYRALARFQDRIADAYGVQAGQEMLAGADAARDVGAGIHLIDQNAQHAVRRALKTMPWRERLRLVWSAVSASLPGRRKATVEAELTRYHKNPEAYLNEFGRQFPTLKRILIDGRNRHMAERLRELEADGRRVLAIVGDGHVPGLATLLEDRQLETVRLPQLQQLRTDAIAGADPTRLRFSVDVTSPEGTLRRDP